MGSPKKWLINHSGPGGEAQKTKWGNWKRVMESSPRRAGESIGDGERRGFLEGKKEETKLGRKERGNGSGKGGCIR